MNLVLTLTLLVMVSLTFTSIECKGDMRRYEEMNREIQLLSTLLYNEHCHYELEEKGEEILLRWINTVDPDDSTAVLDEMESFLIQDVGLEKKFCSGEKSLKCSKVTRRCECPDLDDKFNYILMDGSCQWSTGSRCFSTDFGLGKCIDGTKCLSSKTDDICTVEDTNQGDICMCQDSG